MVNLVICLSYILKFQLKLLPLFVKGEQRKLAPVADECL